MYGDPRLARAKSCLPDSSLCNSFFYFFYRFHGRTACFIAFVVRQLFQFGKLRFRPYIAKRIRSALFQLPRMIAEELDARGFHIIAMPAVLF